MDQHGMKYRLAQLELSKEPVKWLCNYTMWTQGDLAREMGVSSATVTQLKNGKQRLTQQHKASMKYALLKHLVGLSEFSILFTADRLHQEQLARQKTT